MATATLRSIDESTRPKSKSLVWLSLLLALSAVLNIVVALKASLTTDEPLHLSYGARVLRSQPDHLFGGFTDSQMPISALNALPQVIADSLQKHNEFPRIADILQQHGRLTRIPTILATLTLDLLVYLWAFELYGEWPALAACLLCVISPNLMAHGSLATTDMYHTLGVIASLYFFRRFLLQPTWKRAIVSGFVLALAQITKSFALVLYPIVGIALIFAMLKRNSRQPVPARRALAFVGIAAVCLVLVFNVVDSFDNTFLSLGTYQFETATLQHIGQLPLLRHIPVPMPYPFLQGLDQTKLSEETGRAFGDVYLLGWIGHTTDPAFHGFKSYYVVALFFKEPIALQILFVWGLVWVFRNRKLEDFLRGEGLLVASAVLLFCWMSLFSRAQIGVRHILPVIAVETIIAGAAFYNFSSKSRAQKAVLSALVLWMGISVASYYPQMIPYMNEFVHDRRYSYKLLSDSNLDWGQDTSIVKQYVRTHPDVALDPEKPVAGLVLVGANRLTGVYRWDSATYMLRYQPIAQVGYAHFLFDVPAKDLPLLQQEVQQQKKQKVPLQIQQLEKEKKQNY